MPSMIFLFEKSLLFYSCEAKPAEFTENKKEVLA